MQRLEVSGAVRPIYESLGVKRLILCLRIILCVRHILFTSVFRNLTLRPLCDLFPKKLETKFGTK